MNITFLVEDQVPIKSELTELLAIFEARDILKIRDLVVWQEGPLKTWAVVKSINLFDNVSTKVELSQWNESIEVIYRFDEIIGKIKDSQLS